MQPTPRNPLYLLLLIASLIFVLTALAYAVVPVLEDKAIEAGQDPPPSPFRAELRQHGWKWLLVEVAAIIVLGLASMILDHLRLQNAPPSDKIAPESKPPDAPSS